MILEIPTYKDVLAARERLQGHANMTRVLRHDRLDLIAGFQIFLKNETEQKTGSFKYRGAYSKMSLLTASELKRGVVAFSSGNHAQGVALAAKELGTSAVIVMPKTAPQKKKQGTLSLGAKVVEYDIATQSREEIAAHIAATENRVIVPAFDDFYVIAGQGTCGAEFTEQCSEQGIELDVLVTPMGGGGLCAGINLAMDALSPKTKVYGAEPMDYDDQYQSLKLGRRVGINNPPPSLCDALMSPMPGEMTFAINKQYLSGVHRVTDMECLLAMALLKDLFGIDVEPGGAAALAVVLAPCTHYGVNSRVGVILSGGNVDADIIKLASRAKENLMKSAIV